MIPCSGSTACCRWCLFVFFTDHFSLRGKNILFFFHSVCTSNFSWYLHFPSNFLFFRHNFFLARFTTYSASCCYCCYTFILFLAMLTGPYRFDCNFWPPYAPIFDGFGASVCVFCFLLFHISESFFMFL